MVVIRQEESDEINSEIDSLKDRFQELKQRTSELRKKGKNTELAEIYLYDFEPRVKMLKVTHDERDVLKIKSFLDDFEAELNTSENGTDFNNILESIQEAYTLLNSGMIEEASRKYEEISKRYSRLSEDMKRLVYIPSLDIKERIVHFSQE
jgi:hypothetical protein